MKKTVYFVYELEQVSALQERLCAKNEEQVVVVSLRADVEAALKDAGITFVSGESYRNPDATARLALTEQILSHIEADTTLCALQHRGVPLLPLQSIIIQDYLTELLYWLDMIVGEVSEHAPDSIVVWAPLGTVHEENILAHRVIGVIPRAVKLAAAEHNCAVTVLPHLGKQFFWPQKYAFLFKRSVFSLMLFFISAYVRLTTTPRNTKLLVADSWRNAGPYVAKLGDAELSIYDRMEYFKVSWSDIIEHRIQFKDARVYRSFKDRQIAKQAQQEARDWWQDLVTREDDFADIAWEGIPLAIELQAMLTQYVEQSVAADVVEIERIHRMLTVTQPDVVIVRASAARQTHLMMLCQLATLCKIPSIEAQHGWYYVGQAGTHRRSVSAHMATYGPLCSSEMAWCGYQGGCTAVGSPRFDVYHSITKQSSPGPKLKVLVGLFDDITGRWTDTFDIYNLIYSVKELLDTTSDIEVILKVKPNSPFGDLGVQLARTELANYDNFELIDNRPMHELLAETDVTVTVFSTIIQESMLLGCSVIFWAEPPFHNALGKSPQMDIFKQESGIMLAHNVVELQREIESLRPAAVRAEKVTQAREFMSKHFSFHAGSSERMVACINHVLGR